ncbi:MAG: riboflavin biosynthesis protein RibF [Actinobacteria bacterium]|nr:MAG: riboflavin biosynthesis protein RibF [Actinomycetota bacterium]
MNVARAPGELEARPRAVALGTFDGVHVGHRRVLEAALSTQAALAPTVVTFWPHPRNVLGNEVRLLSTLERRLELLAEAGVGETLVVEFTQELARMEPAAFVDELLRPIGTELVVAGADFRFGRGRGGDLATFEELGLTVERVGLVPGVSSTAIRELLAAGEIKGAARLLGRPPEVEGTVVSGDARGGTLGYPTANLRVDPDLLVPAYGIYAGWAAEHRAAISIGTNPHYGGSERRVEAFLLDFAGDLYGHRLVVELWSRLRDERAFASEQELVAQITQDVEATRAAERPI